MKRTYRQESLTGRSFWITKKLKRSRFELIAGLLIFLSLIVCNLIVFFNAENLKKEYLPNQPPHLLFFQRMLYHPIDTKNEEIESDVFCFGFDDELYFEDLDGTSSQQDFTIDSEPVYTAVVGSTYRYEVAISDKFQKVNFCLELFPDGMSIDANNGQIEWVPELWHVGTENVEVMVKKPQGIQMKQSFMVHVAEQSHPLGTDLRGRDLVSSLILGSRWTLTLGMIVVSIALVLGVLSGGLAGYYGGRVDAVINYILSLIGSMPALVIIFLAATIFHFNIYLVMVAVGITWFPKIAKQIKEKVITLKEHQFIEAAKELGLSDARILWQDIIWYNTRPILLTQISYGFAFAIITEVTLSYLKLGVNASIVSWGNMLRDGYALLGNNDFGMVFFPSCAILISTIGFYFLGDGIGRLYQLKRD